MMSKIQDTRYNNQNRQRGFTLLLATLVAGLLLAIGLAIFNITIKEVLLSSIGRESQFAFFAADTGTECALYWDRQQGAFSTSSQTQIECGGQTVTVGGQDYGSPSTFTLDFAPLPYCTTVSVTKFENPRRTNVLARGYNTCDVDNPRRVERTLRVRY